MSGDRSEFIFGMWVRLVFLILIIIFTILTYTTEKELKTRERSNSNEDELKYSKLRKYCHIYYFIVEALFVILPLTRSIFIVHVKPEY